MRKIHLILVNSNVMILLFIICLFIVYFTISPIFGLLESNQKYQTQADNLNKEIDVLLKQYDTLSQDPYRQQHLRGAYHYSQDGDVIFEFPDPESSADEI